MTTNTLKRCGECQIAKPITEFYAWKVSDDGLTRECKPCRRERGRAYYAQDKERIAERDRIRRERDPEHFKEKARRDYEKNRESILARHAAWREENPEYHRDRYRQEYDTDPERFRRATAKYRALAKGNGHEPYDRLGIYDRDQGICHICDEFVEWDDFSIDHIIPISKGGPDTPANVATSHLRCNLSRGNRPLNRGGQ